jgi:UPF0042 nucleotide-binding protein
MQITLISFGYKNEAVPVSNLVFDVRFLKNPYWEEKLRPHSGLEKSIQEYVLSQPDAIDFLAILFPFLNAYIDYFQQSGKTEIKIAFGCTGGQHRSVAIVETVAKTLQAHYPAASVSKVHQEINK